MHRLFRTRPVEPPAAGGSGAARPTSSGVNALQSQVDRLALVCHAIWSLLREHTDLTEEDLTTRVREIDLTDGVLDGKVRRPSTQCPACGRMVASRHVRCLYCGADNAEHDAFG